VRSLSLALPISRFVTATATAAVVTAIATAIAANVTVAPSAAGRGRRVPPRALFHQFN
jgi:hypothetical protein